MYKISVIVPVYKTEKYLSECFESIAAQTVFDKIQLILVNDGSPDNCGKICDAFAEKHSNVKVIHKKNGGVSSARNAGLDAAEGEYIGFVDSDDKVAPDYYEKMLTAVEQNSCEMAFGSLTLVFESQKKEFFCHYPANTVLDRNDIINDFAYRMLTDASQNSACLKLFRKEIIRNNRLHFPVGVKIGEDKMFVLAFLQHCNSAVCTGDNGYYYLDVASSAMHSDKILTDLLSTFDAETELFVKLGMDKKDVCIRKAAYITEAFAEILQHGYCKSLPYAKNIIKENFKNKKLMEVIDTGTAYFKANNGRIYKALADAFEKRSVSKTMLVLAIQNIITKMGERK